MLGQVAAELVITLIVSFIAGFGFRIGWRLVDSILDK